MLTKADTNKAKLISDLRAARNCVVEAANGLSKAQQSKVFLGAWSAKELLAHLIGWDFTNLQALREILEGNLPTFYAYYDSGWKSYNARLVEKYNKDDFSELLADVRESHQTLLGFLETIPATDFEKDWGIRAGRYKVTIDRLLQAEIRDEKKHGAQLTEFTSKGENEN